MATLLTRLLHEPGQVLDDEQIEAAHAATEVGADDTDGSGIVWGVLYGLIAWLACALVALTVWGLTS